MIEASTTANARRSRACGRATETGRGAEWSDEMGDGPRWRQAVRPCGKMKWNKIILKPAE
jgi:hypothetical protein